jgi:hypothetical protein
MIPYYFCDACGDSQYVYCNEFESEGYSIYTCEKCWQIINK